MTPLPSKTLTLTLSHPISLLLLLRAPFSTISPPRHHHDDDGGGGGPSRNVRVSVWWDFENCGVPAGVNVFKVAHSITAAVRANGIKGPVQITAFGDVFQLSRANQVALSATGVNLTHIPGGDKNSADRSLLVDLMYWVSQNPPPAHLFLISGDKDFAGTLHRLRMNNYNILLASKDGPAHVLCSAASIMWRWNDLVRGENLIGRHFNQPPDGPFCSWYGQFKVPLEDPYAETETPGCSASNGSSDELWSDSKVRPVPNAILKAILGIVNSHPNGLSIFDLRAALGIAKIPIDRHFYGYKKFSRFLLSMPDILKVQTQADGQLFVIAAAPRTVEPLELKSNVSECSAVSKQKLNGEAHDQNPPVTSIINKQCGSQRSIVKDRILESKPAGTNGSVLSEPWVEGDSGTVISPLEVNEKAKIVKEYQNRLLGHADMGKLQVSPTEKLPKNEISDARVVGDNITALDKLDSSIELGFFKRVWAKFFRLNRNDISIKFSNSSDKFHTAANGFKKSSSRGNESTSSSADSTHDSCSSGKADVSREAKNDTVTKREGSEDTKGNIVSQGHVDESNSSPGFIDKVKGWVKFWKKTADGEVMSNGSSTELKNMNDTRKHELIFTDSQWSDIDSFIKSYEGSNIILNSRNREDIAQALQKGGPKTLQPLSFADLLRLVDLLISEKKWIEECPFHTYPFRIIQPNKNGGILAHTPNSNGLRSIFLHPSPPSNSIKLSEHQKEKLVESPRLEVSSNINKKLARKFRTEILADCKKHVQEQLKANPEGFNIRSFKKLFIERYGYALDHEKLGYPKLGALLQTIPGVKVESASVSPAALPPMDLSAEGSGPKNQTTTSTLDFSSKNDDNEPWEELGPVEDSTFSNGEVKDAHKVDDDYESSLSDDDLTDSAEEAATPSKGESQNKCRTNGNESSLLQILDSWYSSKDESSNRDSTENLEDTMGVSRNASMPPGSSQTGVRQGDLTNGTSVSYALRQRPAKSYSFVSDSCRNEKDKLIGGMLGALKKSSECKLLA